MQIYPWYFLVNLKLYLQRFIRIASQDFPEMRPLGTFYMQSILLNGWDGDGDRYKNFDCSFRYIFLSSTTVQSFIPIKCQKKKLSMIKIFKFLVSDHLLVNLIVQKQ